MASQEELKGAKPAAAPADKQAHQAAAAGAGAVWRVFNFSTVADAINFANLTPPQGAGEFGVTSDPAGGFDGYYFY